MGYFFAYDAQGISVMHGANPALVGQNLYNTKDANGILMVQRLLAEAQKGGGFLDYTWENSINNKIEPKLGYAINIPNWNIMLGTGFWVSSLERDLQEMQGHVNRNIQNTLIGSISTALIALIIIVILALLVVRTISRPLSSTVRAMNAVASGDGDLTRRLDATGKDEISQLARAFNSFADQVQSLVKNINTTSSTLNNSSLELTAIMAQAEKGTEQQKMKAIKSPRP